MSHIELSCLIWMNKENTLTSTGCILDIGRVRKHHKIEKTKHCIVSVTVNSLGQVWSAVSWDTQRLMWNEETFIWRRRTCTLFLFSFNGTVVNRSSAFKMLKCPCRLTHLGKTEHHWTHCTQKHKEEAFVSIHFIWFGLKITKQSIQIITEALHNIETTQPPQKTNNETNKRTEYFYVRQRFDLLSCLYQCC